ncbi:MAG: sigma 54-interacting transcriptional regulator [Pirellulales bacterium]|nr:sigma 54-interacting transcriptional regulator [Pirellulales bacterium]
MDSMLRLFLDFARPPKLYRRSVDLSDVVTQVIDLVRPRARGHNISIKCQIPGPVVLTADAQQIRQVIVNVMMNAIDAQPDGGAISDETPFQYSSEWIVGRSPVMQDVFQAVGRVANSDVNVLLLGESGVGKELVARAIYQHSRRANWHTTNELWEGHFF